MRQCNHFRRANSGLKTPGASGEIRTLKHLSKTGCYSNGPLNASANPARANMPGSPFEALVGDFNGDRNPDVAIFQRQGEFGGAAEQHCR